MRPISSDESLASLSPLLLEAKQSTSSRPCIWGEGRGGVIDEGDVGGGEGEKVGL